MTTKAANKAALDTKDLLTGELAMIQPSESKIGQRILQLELGLPLGFHSVHENRRATPAAVPKLLL